MKSILISLFFVCFSFAHAQERGAIAQARAESPVARQIDQYLSRLEAMGFSGAIIVEHEGAVVLRKGYGLADREKRTPYTPETVQTMGSITKQFTAAAILLLEQQGLLSTGDAIAEYFRAAPADKAGITLHHLLTHQAGFPGAIGRDAEAIDASDYIAKAMEAPLEFAPGTEYSYSNVGYSLLGIIVEQVSGKPYEQFLREALLLPAGLAKTGYVLPDWTDSLLADGYLDGASWGRVVDKNWLKKGPGWHLRANGGLHTTVDDMHRWLAVLRGKGPLNAAQTARWTKAYVDEGMGDSHYAYGWAVHDTEIGPLIAHNGGNGVFSADFVWAPEQQFFFYVHGNTSVVEAAGIREEVLRAAFDPEFVLPPDAPADRAADPAAVAALAGDYLMEDGAIALKTDDVRLLATVSGQAAIDAVFGHNEAQSARFAQLNERTMRALQRIEAGRLDAFEGLTPPDTDATARAQGLIDFLARQGTLNRLALVGTVANAPGGRLAGHGDATTLVRADFEQRSRILSVIWRADDAYAGTAMGPAADIPSFVLIPTPDGAYTAFEREPPFRKGSFAFEDGCLLAGAQRACRMPLTTEEEAVRRVVSSAYIEGIHNHGPIDDIRDGFHPSFAMLRLAGNAVEPLAIGDWIASIEKRRAEGAAGGARVDGKFVSIDVTGNAATVKLELYRQEKLIFTDYLSLYKFDEGWKIVSKTFFRHP